MPGPGLSRPSSPLTRPIPLGPAPLRGAEAREVPLRGAEAREVPLRGAEAREVPLRGAEAREVPLRGASEGRLLGRH